VFNPCAQTGLTRTEVLRTWSNDMNPTLFSRTLALIALMFVSIFAGSAEAQIYVTQTGANKVSEYTTTGALLSSSFISGLSGPDGIALYGNDLFVGNYSTGIVGEYDATTGATINANFITGLSDPGDLYVNGNTLYAVNTQGSMDVSSFTLSTSGAITASNRTFLTTTSGAYPQSVVEVGGNFYVTDVATSRVQEYDSTGHVNNSFSISGLNYPVEITSNGTDLFIANEHLNNVGEYTLSGAVVNANLITGVNTAFGVSVNGNTLYVTSDTTSGTIGEYTLSGSTATAVNANLVTGLNDPTEMAILAPVVSGYK
jgi:hypothetical protein